jgi:hypothetical protein
LNERYGKVRVGKHVSAIFAIQNGLKQNQWFFSFAVEYAIRKVQETKLGKYIVLPLHQNAGQDRDIKIVIRSFENLLGFKGNYSNDSKFDSRGN